MPTKGMGGNVTRFDLSDPEDFTVLLNSGQVWRIGPAAYAQALAAVTKDPSLINMHTPQEVIDQVQQAKMENEGPWA